MDELVFTRQTQPRLNCPPQFVGGVWREGTASNWYLYSESSTHILTEITTNLISFLFFDGMNSVEVYPGYSEDYSFRTKNYCLSMR